MVAVLSMHMYLSLLSNISAKVGTLNFVGIWLGFLVVVGNLIGFSNIPFLVVFSMINNCFHVWRQLKLNENLECEMKYLYLKVLEGQENMKTLLDKLPEGALIVDNQNNELKFVNERF